MKHLTLLFLFSILISSAQQDKYYSKKGFVAEGYDIVAYFDQQAVEGKETYTTEYDGAKFKFSSQKNLVAFKNNPKKYVPQYGGYCAYAIGKNGKKVSIDPETFEIRDGKLYLFYNSWGINTLNKWNEEGAESLRAKADKNWKKLESNQKIR
ncbi:YHS domain-containing (seleno)protein [Aquimarina brevivitae]|uniref:YHS domain-containing protein n=1 Tax=Aquimarina brevivitae TaxID=323412 RepID=A0A4Q7PGZ1_9FLAO|nr:YHS domain-containing (seleno)protein [Aquimarina brevivitae]RZS99645.1 YHS domain-containing protein [Aquimarina brevivitae]